jgi:hypothetical protein
MASENPTPDPLHPTRPHRQWGGCADELLHYTSRYYPYTEAFLRNLVSRRDFRMAGYQAQRLSDVQRPLMLAMLISQPDAESGTDVITLVERVRDGDAGIDEVLISRHQERLKLIAHSGVPLQPHAFEPHVLPENLPPLDPFLAIAERLEVPVRVAGHQVEVPYELLARHLDSPTSQVRENLQQAVLWLHDAGYRLHNHPHLTHAEGNR